MGPHFRSFGDALCLILALLDSPGGTLLLEVAPKSEFVGFAELFGSHVGRFRRSYWCQLRDFGLLFGVDCVSFNVSANGMV